MVELNNWVNVYITSLRRQWPTPSASHRNSIIAQLTGTALVRARHVAHMFAATSKALVSATEPAEILSLAKKLGALAKDYIVSAVDSQRTNALD
jgi:hypothetical protein